MPARTLPTRLICTLLTVGALCVPVDAWPQGTTQGEPLGRVYVSGRNTRVAYEINIAPFDPFSVFLLAEIDYADIGRPELNGRTGIQAWEASLELPGLGDEFIITRVVVPNEVLNVGDSTNLIVGVSPPLLSSTAPIELVEYTVLMPVADPPVDVLVSVGPAEPTSFEPPAPGFYESRDVGECEVIDTGSSRRCLRAFAETNAAVINCLSLCFGYPVAEETWTRVKARY